MRLANKTDDSIKFPSFTYLFVVLQTKGGKIKFIEQYSIVSQNCNNLSDYYNRNLVAVNVGKTKVMKFGRSGKLAASDQYIYRGVTLEFVLSFTYLGIVLQTKGGTMGHTNHVRDYGISSCARVAMRVLFTKMSHRISYGTILPSKT